MGSHRQFPDGTGDGARQQEAQQQRDNRRAQCAEDNGLVDTAQKLGLGGVGWALLRVGGSVDQKLTDNLSIDLDGQGPAQIGVAQHLAHMVAPRAQQDGLAGVHESDRRAHEAARCAQSDG